jgi:glycosyltransferase 2 family protein
MKQGWQRLLTLVAKFGVAIVLLWWLSRKLDFGLVAGRLRMLSPVAILLSIALTFCSNIIAIVRWKLLTDQVGIRIDKLKILRYGLIGSFFNQALPSSFGGDGIRFWLLYRDRIPASLAVRSIFLDRFIGFVLLLVLSTYGLPRLLWQLLAIDPRLTWLGFVCGILLCVAGFAFVTHQTKRLSGYRIGRLLLQIVTDLKYLPMNIWSLVQVALVSVAAQFLLFCVVWILVRQFDQAVSFVDVLIVVPVIFILLVVPISIAGWGLREGLFVAGLGLVGVSQDVALISSILFGVINLAASLIGGVIWIFDGPRAGNVSQSTGENDGNPPSAIAVAAPESR